MEIFIFYQIGNCVNVSSQTNFMRKEAGKGKVQTQVRR